MKEHIDVLLKQFKVKLASGITSIALDSAMLRCIEVLKREELRIVNGKLWDYRHLSHFSDKCDEKLHQCAKNGRFPKVQVKKQERDDLLRIINWILQEKRLILEYQKVMDDILFVDGCSKARTLAEIEVIAEGAPMARKVGTSQYFILLMATKLLLMTMGMQRSKYTITDQVLRILGGDEIPLDVKHTIDKRQSLMRTNKPSEEIDYSRRAERLDEEGMDHLMGELSDGEACGGRDSGAESDEGPSSRRGQKPTISTGETDSAQRNPQRGSPKDTMSKAIIARWEMAEEELKEIGQTIDQLPMYQDSASHSSSSSRKAKQATPQARAEKLSNIVKEMNEIDLFIRITARQLNLHDHSVLRNRLTPPSEKLKFLFSDNLIPRGGGGGDGAKDHEGPKVRPTLSHKRSYEPSNLHDRRIILEDNDDSDEMTSGIGTATGESSPSGVRSAGSWQQYLHNTGPSHDPEPEERPAPSHRKGRRSPRKERHQERHHHREEEKPCDDEDDDAQGRRSPTKGKGRATTAASESSYEYTSELGDSRIITRRDTDCHNGPSWSAVPSMPRKHRKFYNKNRKFLPQMDK